MMGGLPTAFWAALAVPFASMLVWVGSLNNRVKVLEAEVIALRPLHSICTRLEQQMVSIERELRDFNESTRWMRAAPMQLGKYDPMTGRKIADVDL